MVDLSERCAMNQCLAKIHLNLTMRLYNENTNVLMEDHLQHLLTNIETWLESDTIDIIVAKHLMLVVFKLLKGY
ncbi:hypothetical protein LSH36_589g02093 [Paralvinella palmiformis]|uniref:Uncharacterized protein n=1 Tax=Paralvinella palmiformis TaxID=53620 RepID=A0AAD9J6R1_9ANNE|nr:hypothetical protein LSH36_589g02093 [Paralvinella palmiformis]